jgi:F420-dependent oxidoreductase-like protein
MKLSFKVWPQNLGWPELRDFWVAADAIPAYRTGWIFDHFVPQTGWGNHQELTAQEAAGPCYEAWTALTYLAAVTRRVRVGTLVTSITHRHPALMAKIISSLDHMSGGRVEVGIGAGWNEEEHIRFGFSYPPLAERFDRLEEYLSVLDLLLEGDGPVSYQGRFYSLDDAYCNPPPVQRPRPPLTVGGKGPRRALPVVARFADHWNYPGGPVEEFVAALERLDQLCAESRRDRGTLEVSVQLKYDAGEGWLRSAAEFAQRGASHLVVRFVPPLSLAALESVASQVEAEFGLESAAFAGDRS